ncbi:hypothetical protein N7532_001478 [Penicillium argentinense]|uniref:Uncharacterized protein n=1 Tax=Penicillium argentinense TaxID=1131581 RepID=A0A9W9G2T8_9EURO|nr:uncharacterized protein N7532_001478 [Penicillium argentinense]KAJ5110943.1 hypothetical protein N7532_001478 [Penicillium argentinense]
MSDIMMLVNLDLYQDRASKFAAIIQFRWEVGLMTDYLVHKFKRTPPDGQICIMWDIDEWHY